jgi:formylglycine-generating enzyme required for sulfatase activity
MEGVFLAIVLIQALIFGFFSAYIAKEKGRSYSKWFALGFFFSILAILALTAIPKLDRANNFASGAADKSKADTFIKNYYGPYDLDQPEYQLFLTKRYAIERNNTLGKFILDSKVFHDLEQALVYADGLFKFHLEEKRRSEELIRIRENNLLEQSEIERKQELDDLAAKNAQQEIWKRNFVSILKFLSALIAGGAILYFVWQEADDLNSRKIWSANDTIIQDCSICPHLIQIPSGTFDMGIASGEKGNSPFTIPVHQVKITSFLIGRTEVTQEQWQSIMGNNPSITTGNKDYPVENVSWVEVQLFLKKLSEMSGKTYRLPSEAEWEYAARAGTKAPWSFGSSEKDLANYAWYVDNSSLKIQAVGKKMPNRVGIYDIHGNVSEWVQDVWHSNYVDAPKSGESRDNGDHPNYHVVRGGSYVSKPEELVTGNRKGGMKYEGNAQIGFRVARNN